MKSDNEDLHKKACDNQENYYVDAETGLKVLTAYFLQNRGYCCESYCRHCPYGFNLKETQNEHKTSKSE